MTRDEILAELRRANPAARPDRLRIYADAAAQYLDAQDQLAKRGAVVRHPKTGEPIANPYLKIRDDAAKIMLSLPLDSGSIFR